MRVTITATTLDLLVKAGAGRDYAAPQPDGTYEIEINQATMDRLSQVAFPGESTDETLHRLIDFKLNGGRLN